LLDNNNGHAEFGGSTDSDYDDCGDENNNGDDYDDGIGADGVNDDGDGYGGNGMGG